MDEPPGRYPVAVVARSFPQDQSLARRSTMEIVVRNTGEKTIPNASITLGNTARVRGKNDKFGARRVGTFDRKRVDRDLADPRRPQFVLNKAPIDYLRQKTRPNGSVVEGEVRADTGDDPTYVDTYSLGPLKPGRSRRFIWNVTAVEAGPYEIQWRVHAGQDGRAKAVLEDGALPRGTFAGEVRREPPKSRVDFGDGETIDKR